MKTFGISALLLAALAIGSGERDGFLSNLHSRDYVPEGLVFEGAPKELEINPRIINGRAALPAEFPYQVAILTFFPTGSVQLCGGSLIAHNYVLTAAHCVDNAYAARVLLGTNTLTNASQIEAEDFVRSTAFTIHQNWSQKLAVNDIALIKLSKPVKFSKRIQLVNLPHRRMSVENLTNHAATASGWGRFSDKVKTPSKFLQCVNLKVISEEECKQYFFYAIQHTNICVDGTERKTTCAGDSGGPLVVQDKDGSRTVVGITSFGLKYGCELGYPSVFTRVISYLDWISEKTGIKIRE